MGFSRIMKASIAKSHHWTGSHLDLCLKHSPPTFCRKLGAILGRAFEDCIVSESLFKLLYIFGNIVDQTCIDSLTKSLTKSFYQTMHRNEILLGSLADRKLIATELTEKMPLLLDLVNNEMDQAKEIFDQQEVFFYFSHFVYWVTSVIFLRCFSSLRRGLEAQGRH